MALRIYGITASRAMRPLWAAEEMGLAYEQVPVPYQDRATRTPEFLSVNPNGRIPAVDDDGVIVWESMACVLYLADRFKDQQPAGRSLAAQTNAEHAEILRWTFWVVGECESDALTFLMHSRAMPVERRKPALAEQAWQRLMIPLRVLEQHLQGREWLAADRFTAADITVASTLAWAHTATELMQKNPAVQGWLLRCLARPAFVKLQAMSRKP